MAEVLARQKISASVFIAASFRFGIPLPSHSTPKPFTLLPTTIHTGLRTAAKLYELSRGCPQAVGRNVSAMEYASLETAALAHVDDTYYYGAYCRRCRHSARISLERLRAQLGDT